jgi:hypothetical protein
MGGGGYKVCMEYIFKLYSTKYNSVTLAVTIVEPHETASTEDPRQRKEKVKSNKSQLGMK